MKSLLLFFTALVCPLVAGGESIRITFEPVVRRWTLNNGVIEARFSISPEGIFELERLALPSTGNEWTAAALAVNSPLQFTTSDLAVSARTFLRLVGHWQEDAAKGGRRQVIELEDASAKVRMHLALEIYPEAPVLRYWTEVHNLQPKTIYVRSADMLPWRFRALDDSGYRWFRVNQWSILPRELNFEPLESRLNPAGVTYSLQSGARGLQCAWWALRDAKDHGLFAGWEFDGRATATVRHLASEDYLQLSATIQSLNHPVEPGGVFLIPPAFLGLFDGDWDEAGYQTQRFVEDVLAKPAPDNDKFPYVAWDSWGYGPELDEDLLKRNAEIAAQLGFELFIVDLGWARAIGDWRTDRTRFPSGMKALSDYVHSLGMKFGLHLTPAEASPEAPVLQQNPDWTTSEEYYYHGAKSLCLAHRPVREWVIEELVRVIRDYGVDWVLQDGENMVKECTKTTHTHDPKDSNYANAIDGLDYVLREVQRRTPGTVWENCEDGGNMMTFNMVKNYITSITNDANGALGARQAAYGATYPFPPRYVDRYMPEETLNTYTTRSFLFGGPWMHMTRLAELNAAEREFLASEIAAFKRIRGTVRNGKVFHLTARPAPGKTDAVQAYDEDANRSVAVVTRDNSPSPSFVLRPRGLRPEGVYQITFQDDRRVLVMNGSQLMQNGVRVNLAEPQSAEVVYIDPHQ